MSRRRVPKGPYSPRSTAPAIIRQSSQPGEPKNGVACHHLPSKYTSHSEVTNRETNRTARFNRDNELQQLQHQAPKNTNTNTTTSLPQQVVTTRSLNVHLGTLNASACLVCLGSCSRSQYKAQLQLFNHAIS